MATQMIRPAKAKAKPGVFPTAKPPLSRVIRGLAPEDEVLLNRLLNEPAGYVDHPDFAKSSTECHLFGCPAKLVHGMATRFIESGEPITDAVSAGERVPTLSYAQEAYVFMRYNYARFQVAKILRTHTGRRLSAATVRRLIAWGHRALAARTVIVRLNLPLVLAMAKRTKLSNIDFNEMISEGNMALLRSVEKFDCSRGFKFST